MDTNELSKIYIGQVIEVILDGNGDPTYDLRIRVPSIHGADSTTGLDDSDIPIAKPLLMPGLKIEKSKFIDFIDSITKAYVIFDYSSYKYPMYIGLKNDTNLYDVSSFSIYDYIDFNPIDAPNYLRGRLFYDRNEDFLSYYNENSEVTINIGSGLLKPVINMTGHFIYKGQVIYPTGVDPITNRFTIGLADARYRAKSFPVAVATTTMAPGQTGYVTIDGAVHDIDTSHLDVTKPVYLSESTPGAMTSTRPRDGSFCVMLGRVKISDAVHGAIEVDRAYSEMAVEVTAGINGYPPGMREATAMSISVADPSNPIFTIEPISGPTGEFHFYIEGHKFEKTGPQTLAFENTSGEHYIYFDLNGDLQELVNPTIDEISNVFITYAATAYFHWDAVAHDVVSFIADERHGMIMDSETRRYLHRAFGSRYISGMGVGDMVVDGNGNSNTHVQFSVGTGVFLDEDLEHYSAAKLKTEGLPIVYLSGPYDNVELKETTQAGYAFKLYTDRLAYNKFDVLTSTWSMAEVTDNDYVLYHLFASNGTNGELFMVMGENVYDTLTDARAGATTELNNIAITIQFPETIAIATFILLTKTAMTNALSAAIMSTEDGYPFIDWRTVSSTGSGGASAVSHAELINRDLPNSHPASAISYDTSGLALSWLTGDNVQSILEKLALRGIDTIPGLRQEIGIHVGPNAPIEQVNTWFETIDEVIAMDWSILLSDFTLSLGAVRAFTWNGLDPIRVTIVGNAWGETVYQEFHNDGNTISFDALIYADDTQTIVVRTVLTLSVSGLTVTEYSNIGTGVATSYDVLKLEVYN